jgi:translation initiation factor IF-2
MTEVAAPRRLSKVAKEFNLSTTTLVDFLNSKNIEIEDNPNFKISEDVYQLLLTKFLPDKQDQEKTLPVKEEKKPEKPVEQTVPEEESKEIFIKSNITKDLPPKTAKITGTEQDEHPETPVVAKPKPKVAEVKKEEAPAPVEEVIQPVAKEEVQPIVVTEEKTEPVAEIKEIKEEKVEKEEKAEDAEVGLKVLGKIDLESTRKGKGKKVQQEKKEPEITIPEEPVIVPEEPVAEIPIVEEIFIEPEPEEEIDIIEEIVTELTDEKRREEDILPGLKILGKIDVASFEPEKFKKKPVVSTADPESMRGKSRKRFIKKKPGEKTKEEQDIIDKKEKLEKKEAPKSRFEKHKPEKKKEDIDEKVIKDQIAATLSKLTTKQQSTGLIRAKIKKKQKKELREKELLASESDQGKVIEVIEFITANDLANVMGVGVAEVITVCLNLGLMISINQRLDAETITIVADEFGYEVKFREESLDEPTLEDPDVEERMVHRAPVVAIMGHVDHGKTSLLDHIRSSRITEGESGGITQHIGAYEVLLPNGKKIAFLDTPGHEAFTSMRARGAKVTDIVIIVIAADDSVMPQTREAISHAQAANVPIVFAINKMDKPGADSEKIRKQLSEMNILVEEWGGKYQCQEISAKKGLNIDLLLEKVLLEAEMLELKADPGKRAVGTVIEASMGKGKGIVASVMVQKGTLRIGDIILAGAYYGKVKAMFDEKLKRITSAGPSTPVEVLGFDGTPTAGDKFYVTENESKAKEIAYAKKRLIREQGIRATKHLSLEEIGRRIALGNFKELNIIIKGDVDGSVEALTDSLQKLSNEEVQVNVIHKGVGQISESDVLLASASDAIIIGFQVRPSLNARKLAENEQIEIRTYSIIYNAIEELKLAIEGLLAPLEEEKIVCNIEVRDVFKITKVGTVAGCMVLDGKINRNNRIRLIREGVVVYTGELASLKRFKDDVKEVSVGYECGLNIQNFNDIKVGDIIEGFTIESTKRKL